MKHECNFKVSEKYAVDGISQYVEKCECGKKLFWTWNIEKFAYTPSEKEPLLYPSRTHNQRVDLSLKEKGCKDGPSITKEQLANG